jgi:hypothetical protein
MSTEFSVLCGEDMRDEVVGGCGCGFRSPNLNNCMQLSADLPAGQRLGQEALFLEN